MHTRQRYQQGSLRKLMRESGQAVWEFRFRDHSEPGSPARQMTLSATQYPTETKVRVAIQAKLLRLNGPEAFKARQEPTLGVVIDRFIQEERIAEIMAQPPGDVTIRDGLAYSTATVYHSLIRRHIGPRWDRTLLSRIKPLEVTEWLKTLPLAPKSKSHIKRLLHLLFEKAMLWELIEANRNPIDLVKVKGGSKRQKVPTILTPAEFERLVARLPEVYRVMATVAMCTGLRISEVLALRWEHFDFAAGAMVVEQGVYNGRVGDTKTEASRDQLPLDGEFARMLQEWRAQTGRESGLLFPSPVTGRCLHAGVIMKRHIRPAGEQVGFAAVGWHSFRHSYRGMLDDTGANTGTQQGLMRHANVSTTMNVYGRASMKAKQEANSKVVEMVLPKRALCA